MAVQNKKVFVTPEKLSEMQNELEQLTTVERRNISAKIKEALGYGDLSENSEYNEARDQQAMLEAKIKELEASIRYAEVFKEHKGKGTKNVTLGSNVKLQEKGSKEVLDLTLVGSTEANPYENKISNESPIGIAIFDKQEGDTVKVETPTGITEYVIKSAK